MRRVLATIDMAHVIVRRRLQLLWSIQSCTSSPPANVSAVAAAGSLVGLYLWNCAWDSAGSYGTMQVRPVLATIDMAHSIFRRRLQLLLSIKSCTSFFSSGSHAAAGSLFGLYLWNCAWDSAGSCGTIEGHGLVAMIDMAYCTL